MFVPIKPNIKQRIIYCDKLVKPGNLLACIRSKLIVCSLGVAKTQSIPSACRSYCFRFCSDGELTGD